MPHLYVPQILYLSVWYFHHNRTYCRDHTETYKQHQIKVFGYRIFVTERMPNKAFPFFAISYRDDQIGAWNRCFLWPPKHTKKLLVTNQEPPELYTHLNQCVQLLLRQFEANFKIYFTFSWKKLYLELIWGNIACYRKKIV